MNRTEWDASIDPEPMLRLLPPTNGSKQFRLFACACCRRIWHLLEDKRLRDAVHLAEKFARGKATLSKLEVASRLAQAASEETDLAEWIAEAQAEFRYTERYCVHNARKYAAYAVLAAASVGVIQREYGSWVGDSGISGWGYVTIGSHTWAAAARSNMAMACVFEFFRDPDNESVGILAGLAADSARAAERKDQAVLLRSLFDYSRLITVS